MVDSASNYDRPPARQDDLPEIEIPPPPNGAALKPSFKLTSAPTRRRTSSHELLLPQRRRRFRAKVLLFSVIGFGLGILIGIGFLLG